MSQPNATQGQLPDVESAFDHLFTNVHQQAFFNKLASHGIEPQTHKEAQDLLQLAAKLRIADEQGTLKQAEADSPYAAALADLDAQLNKSAGHSRTSEQNAAIKQAAAQLAQDPDIFNAVLAIKAAEADQLAHQMGLVEEETDAAA